MMETIDRRYCRLNGLMNGRAGKNSKALLGSRPCAKTAKSCWTEKGGTEKHWDGKQGATCFLGNVPFKFEIKKIRLEPLCSWECARHPCFFEKTHLGGELQRAICHVITHYYWNHTPLGNSNFAAKTSVRPGKQERLGRPLSGTQDEINQSLFFVSGLGTGSM